MSEPTQAPTPPPTPSVEASLWSPARRPALLCLLWTYAALNYLYCDLLVLMDARSASRAEASSALFGVGVLMEVSAAMVLLSRLLPYRANRWANLLGGAFMTAAQLASLGTERLTDYYLFFTFFEVSATVTVFLLALRWPSESR